MMQYSIVHNLLYYTAVCTFARQNILKYSTNHACPDPSVLSDVLSSALSSFLSSFLASALSSILSSALSSFTQLELAGYYIRLSLSTFANAYMFW